MNRRKAKRWLNAQEDLPLYCSASKPRLSDRSVPLIPKHKCEGRQSHRCFQPWPQTALRLRATQVLCLTDLPQSVVEKGSSGPRPFVRDHWILVIRKLPSAHVEVPLDGCPGGVESHTAQTRPETERWEALEDVDRVLLTGRRTPVARSTPAHSQQLHAGEVRVPHAPRKSALRPASTQEIRHHETTYVPFHK